VQGQNLMDSWKDSERTARTGSGPCRLRPAGELSGSIHLDEQVSECCGQAIVVFPEAGVPVGEVLQGERQPGADGRPAVDRACHLKLRLLRRTATVICRDYKSFTGFHKAIETHGPCLVQQNGAVAKVIRDARQPRARLHHALHHEHPWEHREARKMVLKILLGKRNLLVRLNAFATNQSGNAIDETELHEQKLCLVGGGAVRRVEGNL